MNLKSVINSWRGTRSTQRFLIVVLGLSSLANVILAIGLINVKVVATMIPPVLRDNATVGSDYASANYSEAWALYTSQTLGNVTPNSVKFVRKAIEPLLSPTVYQDVMKALEKQVEDIRGNHVTLYFEPRRILREKETGKIFVHGQSVLEAPSGDRKRTERTYEFKFEILNYMPSITHVMTYEGKPRTVAELELMKRLNEERRRRGGGRTGDEE